jgi:hypothetical protein
VASFPLALASPTLASTAEVVHWPPPATLTRLVLALGVGLFVGPEREWRGHEAGLRTFGFAALLGPPSASRGAPRIPRSRRCRGGRAAPGVALLAALGAEVRAAPPLLLLAVQVAGTLAWDALGRAGFYAVAAVAAVAPLPGTR